MADTEWSSELKAQVTRNCKIRTSIVRDITPNTSSLTQRRCAVRDILILYLYNSRGNTQNQVDARHNNPVSSSRGKTQQPHDIRRRSQWLAPPPRGLQFLRFVLLTMRGKHIFAQSIFVPKFPKARTWVRAKEAC